MTTPKLRLVKENGLDVSIMAVDLAKAAAAAATSTPILGAAAEILHGILQQISQTQQNKDLAKEIARRCVRIFTDIHEMLDAWGIAPGPMISKLIKKFEADLSEIETFVAKEVQKHTFRRLFVAKQSAEKLQKLQKRVDDTMDLFKMEAMILCGTAAERVLSSTSERAQNVVSGNGHEKVVEDDNIATNLIIDKSHLPPEEELFIKNGLRIYSTSINGQIAVVKIFLGRDAPKNWRKTVQFDKIVMHPHILSLKAMSSRNACTPFIVYGINEHQSPELFTATAILSGIDSTFVAGATLISGISSALDYLSCSDIRLDSADIENIYIFMDGPNKAVLSINTYYRLSNSTPSDLLPSQMALDALNYLCLKIFNGANQLLYKDYLVRDGGMSKPSDDTVTESSLEVSSKDDDLSSTTGASSSVNDAKLSQPRREIIWQSLNECTTTLKDTSQQFKNALKSRSITSFHLERRKRVGGANQSHRCQGYRREEVTLTPVVADCRVITDTTPILHEQCPICGEKVGEGPFRCVCGNDDDGVSPTVRCTWCLAWGHSRCRTSKDFLCKDCAPSMNFQGSGMSRPRRFCGRQWCPQAPWSIGKYCWYQFVQNGRPVIARYQCLVLHDSTNKNPPWSSPQLWRQV